MRGRAPIVLAVDKRNLPGSPRFDRITDLNDLAPHWLAEIENFFATYKTLEGTTTEITGWRGAEDAREVIAACQE